MTFGTLSPEEEEIGAAIVDSAYRIHKELGPGLLEKIYEACMEYELKKAGLDVRRQISLPFKYADLVFDEGLRIDLLINDLVVVELKAVETVNPVWKAQVISHLKLLELDLGYLINFNVPLIKQGIQHIRV